jgi:hypothetical protein
MQTNWTGATNRVDRGASGLNGFATCMSLLLMFLVVLVGPSHIRAEDGAPQVVQEDEGISAPGHESGGDSEIQPKKYHWLFRQKAPELPPSDVESSTLLDQLDREIKLARKLYLSGETDNAILKYRNALDQYESILEDIPPGNGLLNEMEQRFVIFDELATKLLGPVHLEPREDLAGGIFHIVERRRICRRNLTLKKAGQIQFFDAPNNLIKDESDVLISILQLKNEGPTHANRQAEAALKSSVSDIRKTIQKSSPHYAALRRGTPISLAELRKDILGQNEMILDLSLFSDRIVIGVITSQRAIYHQVPVNRAEIDKGVFYLQEKLKEFNLGSRSTFMGHAWKEAGRRIHRTLLGQIPPLPSDKKVVFVIPDRSLWYLPFSIMLDAEDRPFGMDKVVSLIPSADMLKLVRSSVSKTKNSGFNGDLLLFESIPWIAEEDMKESAGGTGGRKKAPHKMSEEARIEQLILTNPVYPKPSEIVITVQKIFRKFDVWVGPAATMDRFREYKERGGDVAVMAVPMAVTDGVTPERQPSLFFSPDKKGRRQLPVRDLFAVPLGSRLVIVPVSWFDVPDKESATGEGPLLLNIALLYSGVKMGMINYSDPNWGTEEPFVLSILKKASQKATSMEALTGYAREMPSGLDASFSGKPPAWTGWILSGDPGS